MQWRHTSSPNKKKSSRLSALANHVHGILGPLWSFAPWLPSKWTNNQCPGVLRHPITHTQGYSKRTPGTTQLRAGSSPRQRPSAYGSANSSPTAAISLGYHGSPPVQSGLRAERLPSVSAHEAFSRWEAIPFRCRGGSDSKKLFATTGGRLFRHRHSQTCDAIQQVPRFCWWLRRKVVFRIA